MSDYFSRRDFIKATSLVAGSMSLSALTDLSHSTHAAPYALNGRIVIVSGSNATHGSSVNEDVVQRMVDEGIQRLAGIQNSVAAFESLFPAIQNSHKIAVKPNLLNSSVPTRKETAKAVVNRIVQMLNGSFSAENVHFYERHSFSSRGYSTAYFGHNIRLERSDFSDRGYYIHCDGANRPYAKTLADCDYLINMPVLKDHSCGMDFTLSMKNHLGTVNPEGSLGIHANENAVLDIMSSDVIRTKTKLYILDALYGVYAGGPGGRPMTWSSFPNSTPNRLMFSTDPVTIDYWGRRLINTERSRRGMSPKQGNYIERAANNPYNIGVADPDAMEVIEVDLDSTSTPFPTPITINKFQLFQNYPNPFNHSTEIRFQLKSSANVEIKVFDSLGRKVTTLAKTEYPAGIWSIFWRGIDDNGWPVSSGNYIYRIQAGKFSAAKMMTLAK